MSWTVTTDKEKRADGSIVVFLIYTDGTRTIKDALDVQAGVSDDSLAVTAKNRIAWLDAQDASFDAITPGPVTPKDPDPIAIPTPTQDDIDKSTFLADYRTLLQSNKAIGLGLLDVGDKNYVQLVAKIKAEFKLEYLSLI